MDFEYERPATIGDLIWEDKNNNGTFDAGEGLNGVTVFVDTDSDGVLDPGEISTVTAGDGAYTLSVPPGTHSVVVKTDTLPAGSSNVADRDSDNDSEAGVTVNSGDSITDVDFEYMETGTVSGHLYYDTNGNGTQDIGEPNLANVDVVVTDVNDTLHTVSTDANGDWTATAPPGSTTANVDETDTDFTDVVPVDFTQTEGDDPTTVTALAGTNASAGNDGYYKPAAIGNRVWLDENGDGMQDAGEAGISGVRVYVDSNGDNAYTPGEPNAVTDSNGNYLLKNLTPGNHAVRVDTTTLPDSGLNLIFDEDSDTASPDGKTSVTVTAGGSHLTAGFGYNWVSKGETDSPASGATGAIGDRIWNDADGDGVQDSNEVGIVGITVNLLTDDNGDGEYGGSGDNPATTTTTGPDGRYIFDGLAPGSYVVEVVSSDLDTAGYNTIPTGDPDSNIPPDGKTTSPVVLAPGDVFVNADFGYNVDDDTDPITVDKNSGFSIGDRIYLDADASGTYSVVDTGIAGVSVVLEDASGNIIGTAITDESGAYRFDGLPDDDYTVKVVDNANLLDGLSITADPDGGADNESNVTLSGNNLDQDFGYAPTGHSGGEGLIGDRIFLDSGNGFGGAPDGDYDVGEGIEGVTVLLYDGTGATLLATTSTDKYGRYEFGNLDTSATYQVHVDTATLPNGGIGLTNSIDPDGSNDSVSTVDLNTETDGTVGDGIVLDQNFGYTAGTPNTISGTIWDDTNADGILNETGNGIFGVTVILRDNNGNIVGTTVTNGSGNYRFGNLPNGTYTVDVVDTTGVLDGYWHSVGPDAGDGSTDNNSQEDSYTVTVSGGATDSTGNFGYYKKPASVSHLVWEDLNGDGKKDTGEQGIPNVKVTATVTYDNGATFTVTTKTDKDGKYSFDNLLLDEDYNGSGGTGQPSYVIQVEPPAGMVSTHTPTTDAANADNQADNPEGEFAALTQGENLSTKDFGFRSSGSIGDHVWLDINGDGKQDLNESPLGGVTVKLYKDDGDNTFEPGTDSGEDGDPIATVLTALDGSYLFENLSQGKYWVQIDGGLPANLEVTDTSNHENTTDKTKPADFVSLTSANLSDDTVDFGFNATSGTSVLGNKVWFDLDPDQGGTQHPNAIQDSGEVGLARIDIFICNGDLDDPCNPSSTNYRETVITKDDGSWLVTGLTPDATYTVAVDPTTLSPGMSTTPTNGDLRRVYTMPADGSSLLVADYGFTDNDSTQSYGTIGERVYQDVNGNGDDESGTDPGISGVTVELLNSSGVVVATTVTDATGKYTFTGLELNKEYKVRIKGDSDILSSMTRTQTGLTDDTYTFTPTATDPNKTDAYFGFKGSGSDLGDYVWFDMDSDGIQDPEENGISNVEVRLYLDNGSAQGSKDATDTLVRTMTTDSNGKYLFSGLETDKNYIVEVVPPANFSPSPAGSDTVTDGTVNSDGNAETGVNFTATTLDVDFALTGGGSTYSIGDKVWYDTDGKGDVNESCTGISGVTVDLYLGDHRIATTTTSSGGSYSFNKLPPNSNYEVRISDRNNILANFISTTGGTSKSVNLSSGSATGINFGWKYPIPTYATVSSFNAYIDASNKVVLEWTTASEIGTIGFHLERFNEQSRKYQTVTEQRLPGMLASPHGGTYRYVDKTAKPGVKYTYRVVEVAINNQITSVPYKVQASKSLPMRNEMFADGPAGYTLQHQDLSRAQLKRFVARSESALEFAHQQKNKTGNTLKIPVSKDGLVYLTASKLAAVSGLSEKQVGKYLKAKKCLITLEGEAVAVITANTGSALWFYGQAPTRNDIGQNIYLLELGKKGVKIASKGGRAKQTVDTPQAFSVHNKIEENHQPIHLYINTPVKDFWAWEYLMAYGSEYAITHTVAAPHLTGEGVAAVTVNLVGVSSENAGQEAPFKVAVSLNGTEIGTAEWSEKGDYQFQTEISAGLLEESGNEVQLVSQLNSGVTYSFIYFDSIELDYERSYEAVDGELLFSTTHYESVTVQGFSSAKVLALDVTEPNNPQRIRTLPGKNEVGEYSITVLTKPDHQYYITENIRQTVSEDITVDTPSQLRSSDNQADYLVISPLNMMESAQRLAEYRTSQGMATMVVDIEDVQDEFSRSLAAPEAIHDFLAYIYTYWTQVPNYIVLIGDGSYDYKNYLDYGYPQVPTELVATPDGFFPSDNALADVSGNDGIPEFALGRIPAVDSIELNRYIDKLIEYEKTISSGSNAVMAVVSDNLDPAAGDFQASAERVHELAAQNTTVHRFDAQVLGQSQTHDRIIDALQQGASILHYVGHSSLVAFGKKNNLLSNDDINTISDIGRPLLMTSMACSTASFGYSPMNSIGESAVLRANGGAVGFFGATGLSQNHLADIMAEGFYRNLFNPATFRVGDAIVHGKQYSFEQGTERSFLDIYNLLGDPAMLTPVQEQIQ